MIKVNLISKNRRAYRGRNWTKIISFSLFGLVIAYFLGATIYVLISTMVLNNKIKAIENESKSISSAMLANNEKLSRFVLTKMILTQMQSINKTKFHYKDYLDQISTILPSSSTLIGVDFKSKGWVSATIKSDDVLTFQTLESALMNKSTWADNKFFSGSYIESVAKDKNGSYSTRLQLKLKGNG